MKKIKRIPKLDLARSTIRTIDTARTLGEVAGGSVVKSFEHPITGCGSPD